MRVGGWIMDEDGTSSSAASANAIITVNHLNKSYGTMVAVVSTADSAWNRGRDWRTR